MEETEVGLSDRSLIALADNIPEGHVMKLGVALGLSKTAVDRYLATNRIDGEVTCKGTRSMLFAWRENTPSGVQAEAMRVALQDAELTVLIGNHLALTSESDGMFLTSISQIWLTVITQSVLYFGHQCLQMLLNYHTTHKLPHTIKIRIHLSIYIIYNKISLNPGTCVSQ